MFWADFKKPIGSSFLEVRPGLIGVIGLGLVVAGIAAHLWSALTLAMTISTPTGVTHEVVKRGSYQYLRNPIYLAGATVFVGIY